MALATQFEYGFHLVPSLQLTLPFTLQFFDKYRRSQKWDMDSTKDHRCYAMVDGGRRRSFDGGGASGEILDRLECAEILEAELRSSVLSSFPPCGANKSTL